MKSRDGREEVGNREKGGGMENKGSGKRGAEGEEPGGEGKGGWWDGECEEKREVRKRLREWRKGRCEREESIGGKEGSIKNCVILRGGRKTRDGRER